LGIKEKLFFKWRQKHRAILPALESAEVSRHRRSGPLRAPDYGEASTPHAGTRAGAIASASPYRQDGHSFPAGNRSPRDQQTANAGADTTTAVRPYAVLGSARRSHFALCGMAGRAGQIGQDRFHWSSQKRRPPSDNAEAFVLHDLRRTFRAGLSVIPGISDLVRELVIGHTKPGRHKVYDRTHILMKSALR